MTKISKKLLNLSLGLASLVLSFGLLGNNSVQAGRSNFELSSSGSVIWGVRSTGGGLGISDEIGFEFGVEGAGDSVLLFEDLVFTEGDAGMTFTATSDNDPDFEAIVAQLTNGMIDEVFLNITFPSGDRLENRTDDSFGDSDFQGREITSIDLVINTLDITSPGNDPNGDGNWTQVTFDGESAINPATIPEAPSLWGVLAFCGFVGISDLSRQAASRLKGCDRSGRGKTR